MNGAIVPGSTTPPTVAAHPDPAVRSGPDARAGWIAVAVGILAATIAFLGSWNASLWTDEAATVSASGRSLTDLWAMAQNIDAVHSAYYLLMHGWTEVFGTSAMSLRMPSALAVGVATAGVYLLGRRLIDPGGAISAAALFAVLPRVTWMGIEARSWAFVTAAAVWLTWLLVRLLDAGPQRYRGRIRIVGWVGYGLLTTVAVALNIYLVFLVAAHGITQLLRWRTTAPTSRWAWLAAAAAGTAAASPVVLLASGQSGQLGGERYGPLALLRGVLVNQYALGETPAVDGTDPSTGAAGLLADGAWRAAAIALAVVLLGLCAVAVISAVRGRGAGPAAGLLGWTLPWVVLPTVLLGTYSMVVEPLYSPRYLAYTAPAFALLAGSGLARLRPAGLRLAAAGAVLLLVAPVYVSQRQVTAKSGADWSQVAALVAAGAEPGDGVYFAPRYPVPGDTYAQSTRGIAIAYPDDFTAVTDLTLAVPGPADATLTGRSRWLADVPDRLATVDRVWEIRRNGDPAGTAAADATTLTGSGFALDQEWVGSLDTVRVWTR